MKAIDKAKEILTTLHTHTDIRDLSLILIEEIITSADTSKLKYWQEVRKIIKNSFVCEGCGLYSTGEKCQIVDEQFQPIEGLFECVDCHF